MSTKIAWMVSVVLCFALYACGESIQPLIQQETRTQEDTERSEEGLSIDPSTGIPFAYAFRHPVAGFATSDYGFGFGLQNHWFCMSSAPDGTCASYGVHLGRDTQVTRTPVGTEVVAPADGIVRITTDIRFGGYGSDTRGNAAYDGCVVVLEHLLGTGEAVTTLLGHLECERGPEVGARVARGEHVGRIGHYWHGAGNGTDWHHLHWAMRKGRFQAKKYQKTDLLPYVQGYASAADCSVDPVTGALTHPNWIDPFIILATAGDKPASTDAKVRHHPSGSFLQDPGGGYWLVQDDATIARVPSGVARNDRYPTSDAIPVTHEEIGCYHQEQDVESNGLVTLYVRPGSSAVVMAYLDTQERYDLITWEAFLSWGFQETDIAQNVDAPFFEEVYRDSGFRLLRPGTLVKANEESEVSIVTMQQTRLPIASEEAFEHAGFKWNRITSVPASVITEVAGPRENRHFTEGDLFHCAVPSNCPGGIATCGGGGLPEPEPEPIPQPETAPEEEPEYHEPSEPEPGPKPEPEPETESEPAAENPESSPAEPTSTSEPEPPSAPVPVLPAPLTIELHTLVDMNGFSLWLLSGSLYAMPEDTAENCTVTMRSATCTVDMSPGRPVEFWMRTGIPNTPWSPGLNWETNVCDPFAEVSVWRGESSVLLQMIPVEDGCHFLVEGE